MQPLFEIEDLHVGAEDGTADPEGRDPDGRHR